MKKILFMAACIIMMSMTANAITINKAMLVHNGEVTLYDGDKIQEAINAASDGDAIYMTTGVFAGFTVNKAVEIRGSGETTVISGDVSIANLNGLSMDKPVLNGISVSGEIVVTQSSSNILIRKCKFGRISFSQSVRDILIDRCFCTGEMRLANTIDADVINSKIFFLVSSGTNSTIKNCNVYKFMGRDNGFRGTIINSILYTCYYYSDSYYYNEAGKYKEITSSLVMNTYLGGLATVSSSVALDCYVNGNNMALNEICECQSSSDIIKSQGFIGTDGTIIGIYGGETPYTLDPSVPKVTSSDLQLDNENKQLNVKLTVSPQ